jgi:hypothetical protein
MLRNDFTLSKKHLGWLLLISGVLAFLGILSIDILDIGREGGIGPAQQMALVASALIAIVGLTLIPLGDTPA